MIRAGSVATDPATAPTRSPIACRSTSPAETPTTSSTRSSAVRLSSREAEGRRRARRLRAAEVDGRLHSGENRCPAAEASTCNAEANPLRARSERSAGSTPDRASWVGNTPRVSSRSDSSAVVGGGHEEVDPVRGRPEGDGSAGADELVGHGHQVRQHLARDGLLEGLPGRVVRLDDPRARGGQLTRGVVELGHVSRQLALHRGVAEGDRGLVGQRRQEPDVGRAQPASLRDPHRDGAQPGAPGAYLDLVPVGCPRRRPDPSRRTSSARPAPPGSPPPGVPTPPARPRRRRPATGCPGTASRRGGC